MRAKDFDAIKKTKRKKICGPKMGNNNKIADKHYQAQMQ